jgi:hypothetical protein
MDHISANRTDESQDLNKLKMVEQIKEKVLGKECLPI